MLKRAAAVLFCLAVACGGSPPGAGEDAPDRVVGTITEVEPEDETALPTNFTVEEESGEAYSIAIDPELDYGFELLHVREHFVTEDPVDVSIDERDGTPFATAIEEV